MCNDAGRAQMIGCQIANLRLRSDLARILRDQYSRCIIYENGFGSGNFLHTPPFAIVCVPRIGSSGRMGTADLFRKVVRNCEEMSGQVLKLPPSKTTGLSEIAESPVFIGRDGEI